jgi:hypothetical protein
MNRKNDPSVLAQPEHPAGSEMPDIDDMKPERIGFEVTLGDGTRITIENAVSFTVRSV